MMFPRRDHRLNRNPKLNHKLSLNLNLSSSKMWRMVAAVVAAAVEEEEGNREKEGGNVRIVLP